jgi:hypothetical protein
MPPETKMASVRIALVKAPGGVLIGFSGPGEPSMEEQMEEKLP